MSSVPAVPPLPQGYNSTLTDKYTKPPIPPLPDNFNPREESYLAAPMPERAMPSLPADITRTLDDSVRNTSSSSRSASLHPYSGGPGGPDYRRPSPAPSAAYGAGYGVAPGQVFTASSYPGGFARPQPSRTGPSPAPPSHAGGGGYGAGPGGFVSPPALPGQYNLPNAMSAMSLGPQQQQQQPSTSPYPNQAFSPQQSYPQHYSPQQSPSPGRGQSPSQSQGPPALTAPLPTPESLTAARNALLPLTHPPHAGQSAADHVRWIRDVFFCVDRSISQQQSPDASTEHQASIVLHAPLPALLHFAISILLTILSSAPSSQGQSGPVESHVAEALYLKSIVYASDPYLPSLASPNPSTSSRYSGSHVPHAGGAFEDLEHSPRLAFQTFSSAARFGFLPAWFKLGRDYELVGDATRARECFERGAGVGGGKASVGCLYRLGMAHLLGQLSFSPSPTTALPLLHRAALLATTETPQPAYVYGLILLDEFDRAKVNENVLVGLGLIPRGSTATVEARRHIERAAYLAFAPAQYKLGHAYEYAVSPFPFDALLSVQYYSLASQQGEAEADMALSKWFLCGAEGAFEKDEALALTFAEKAARKGLGSAEFALGYYAEVGVGGSKDIALAKKWYAKAVSHGNPDAPDRLRALSQPAPQALSRTEHDAITDKNLVRTRTQARLSAQKDGRHAKRRDGSEDADAVMERMRAQAHGGAHSDARGDSHGHHGHGNDEHGLGHESQSFHLQHAQTMPTAGAHPQSPPPQARYSLVDSPVSVGLPSSPTAGRRPSARRSESAGHVSVNGGHASHRPSPRPISGPGPSSTVQSPYSMSPPELSHSSAASLPTPPSEARPAAGRTGGAATFEEMGFKTGKAEEKECVIM